MSPFRLFATIAACAAIALLSYSLFATPPSYQEAVLALHLAGHGAPIWPEGVTSAGAIQALGAGRGALSTITSTLMLSDLQPPLWIWVAWLVEALPGGIAVLRGLSALSIGLSALALWRLYRRVTPHERDHLYLLALFLLIPSTHLAATSVGPEAFAILGLSMALSGASAAWRKQRLTLGHAALLGGGAGIASASALIAMPAAMVLLVAGLIRPRGAGRWVAVGVALAMSLPLFAIALSALPAYAPEFAADRGILAPALQGEVSAVSPGELLIAAHPGRLQPPGLVIVLLLGLALGAIYAGTRSLLQGRKRPEFMMALTGLCASGAVAFAVQADGSTLVPLAPLVAVMLGTGVLSLETKVLAMPLIALYGLTGAGVALTDRGEPHWQLSQTVASKRDFLDLVVIDQTADRVTALPYLIALAQSPEQPVLIGQAVELLGGGAALLGEADLAHVIHPPGPEGAARLEAFRAQVPGERQRLVEQAAHYDLIQLSVDHALD
ncbi:MAG: glycosyltransferase family 39 protein [Pseudomonadota bacterium]